jgi:hypothetical protein
LYTIEILHAKAAFTCRFNIFDATVGLVHVVILYYITAVVELYSYLHVNAALACNISIVYKQADLQMQPNDENLSIETAQYTLLVCNWLCA